MKATLPLFLMVFAITANAKESQDPAAVRAEEDRIAKAEEEAEISHPPGTDKLFFEGVLKLLDENAPPNPFGVVGSFESDDGKKYSIKLAEPGLLNQLKQYDEKKVKIEAKTRVKGKYLVVLRVVVTLIAPNRELPSRPSL